MNHNKINMELKYHDYWKCSNCKELTNYEVLEYDLIVTYTHRMEIKSTSIYYNVKCEFCQHVLRQNSLLFAKSIIQVDSENQTSKMKYETSI